MCAKMKFAISNFLFLWSLLFLGRTVLAENLKLRTMWILNDQYAGELVALDAGWYQDNDIKLTLQPYGEPDYTPPYEAVMNGSSDVGVAEISLLVQKIVAEQSDIVIFAVERQISPAGFIVLEDSKIETVNDFEGKTFGYFDEENIDILAAFSRDRGVDFDKIVKKKIARPQITMLLDGEIDFYIAYETNAPAVLKIMGIKSKMFSLVDVPKYKYGHALFCKRAFFETHFSTLKFFLQTTIEGWRYSFLEPERTAEIIMKFHPQKQYVLNDFEKTYQRVLLGVKMQEYYITHNVGLECIGCMAKLYWESILENTGLSDEERKNFLNRNVTFDLVNEIYFDRN